MIVHDTHEAQESAAQRCVRAAERRSIFGAVWCRLGGPDAEKYRDFERLWELATAETDEAMAARLTEVRP